MAKSVLSAEHFHDEAAAFAFVEAKLWPHGPVCPHCGGMDRIRPLKGETTRIGLRKCYDCRKNFTVRHGTIFEASHLDLHLWLQAIHLLCASKKGISSHQLHRILGCTLKTAWFLSHRIREAMTAGELGPLGGSGVVVEIDETYFGNVAPDPALDGKNFGGEYKGKYTGGKATKRTVLALVERGGSSRTFHIDHASKAAVQRIIRANVAPETVIHTDESNLYGGLSKDFGGHESVKHSAEEYVRGNVTTNGVEGYFGVFKRGMRGVYQHCAEKHLQRYLNEFDFRYTNRSARGVDDRLRAEWALLGVVGKRLTYRTTKAGAVAR